MLNEMKTTGEFFRNVDSILFELSEFLQPKEPSSISDVPSLSSNPVWNISPSYFRLANLELQKFDGKPLHLYSFWDSFSSAVDKN